MPATGVVVPPLACTYLPAHSTPSPFAVPRLLLESARMIFESVTMADLAAKLAPHMDKPAWPGLDDPKARARAKRWAKKLGIWDRLGRAIEPEAPIPVVKRSVYRDYQRTGRRTLGQDAFRQRLSGTVDAALALWLRHPAADLDRLQDLLWAWCETTSWVWPAHERRAVDLGSSHLARTFAEILWMLDPALEPEVKQRVGDEIERRAITPITNWKHPDGWATVPMNWNHVCNANIITTALYRIRDPRLLAAYIHPLCQRLDYALGGFAPDGGCLEGPGYWNYGFGHFVDAALVLRERTGGAVNLMDDPRIEPICRYPLAAHVEGAHRAAFADGGHGYITADVALAINRFLPIPELYAISTRDEQGRLAVASWRGLLLYSGEKAADTLERTDCLLPHLGMVKLRAGGDHTTLLALAGRNNVPHNHNDIGSFILHRRGACLLTDPGAPRYTRKTFSSRRYEILFCRSRGHSVPLINGTEQQAGSQYYATLEAEGLGTRGPKAATLDLSQAYPDKTLERFIRRFDLAEDGSLALTDRFAFTRKPRALEEAFITFEPVRITRGGRSAVIGTRPNAVTLRSTGDPGTFAAERLVEESKEGRSDGVVTRITFTPATLARELTLAFTVS